MAARGFATRLGLRGATERLPLQQRVLRAGLARLSDRTNLFLARGMHDPYQPIDHRAFMLDTPWAMALDYVTHAGTELVCREIDARRVPGEIAGLGVGRGQWARTANRCLPDRSLYLFDTFTGFDPRDLAADAAAGLSDAPPYPMSPVSVEDVRRALPYPDRAVFRTGWFPDTAVGLDDVRFALVQIDVGVMSATLAGLRYFQPRMAPGGTLIVEDYNNRHARGVRLAVETYLAEVPAATAVWPNGAILFVSPPAAH